ncbi:MULTISPECIES: rhomboid family intramembrane serine protease [unclassified Dokdonia]|uniref:rhomboid family intramembrane serine protease n=1 Tax=unclassified Dokdonia TaxID=2615033 RepID=UPI00020A6FBB|nr:MULTISPECIES: rhomboid family intramembrane serine protease [unclassified Dokdonia]AEE20788.1 Rhomboid family protein [Dokdonia sp. 4H-3-7-5]AWH75100.1 rhomboid family intramembrane serine protease [Dokdonia sp. Dokd-P16]|tara:strand:+ start:342471 stop:343103 length:633 start_codon:yes stop_codon:yes gene_type:complete
MADLHPVTIAIILANVLFSMSGFNNYSMFEKYKFNIGAIRRGEQVRMVSSAFLHANTQHLLFNMLTLYFFANAVIYTIGVPKFLLVYLSSLLLGNILSYFLHKDEYHYSAVGASGAVMGVVYAGILLNPGLEIYFLPGWVFGVGYMIYSIYGMVKRNDNIGHDAHFGGAIAGYAIALISVPELLEVRLPIVLALAAPILVFFVLFKMGKI